MAERSKMRSMLADKWDSMHNMYLHDEQPALGEVPARLKPTPCCQMGLCVCSGAGLKAKLFHKNLVSFLRPAFTPKRQRRKRQHDGTYKPVPWTPAEKEQQAVLGSHRKLLKEGFIVLRLEHQEDSKLEAHFLHDSWARLASKALGQSNASSGHAQSIWLHLGYVNYTSWGMGLLQLVEDHERLPCDRWHRLLVQDPYRASDCLACFRAAVDFDLQWAAKVYHILSDCAVLELSEMVPNWVHVVELQSVESFCCWQGWEIEEIRWQEHQRKMGKRNNQARAATPISRGPPLRSAATSSAAGAAGAVAAPGEPEPDETDAIEDPGFGIGHAPDLEDAAL